MFFLNDINIGINIIKTLAIKFYIYEEFNFDRNKITIVR